MSSRLFSLPSTRSSICTRSFANSRRFIANIRLRWCASTASTLCTGWWNCYLIQLCKIWQGMFRISWTTYRFKKCPGKDEKSPSNGDLPGTHCLSNHFGTIRCKAIGDLILQGGHGQSARKLHGTQMHQNYGIYIRSEAIKLCPLSIVMTFTLIWNPLSVLTIEAELSYVWLWGNLSFHWCWRCEWHWQSYIGTVIVQIICVFSCRDKGPPSAPYS